MVILVTDRQSIERGFLVRSSYALISIRDSGAARARVPKVAGLRGVLLLASPRDGNALMASTNDSHGKARPQ